MQVKQEHTFNNFTQISHLDVIKIISSFKQKRSSGWDEIPIFILKKCSVQFAKPLAYLVNLSFESGTFPDLLKLSLIRPVHKKDCKKIISNYRPIALLPSFSKVFEKAVHLQLSSYFEAHELLYKSQHGFRKGYNTNSAILELVRAVSAAVDASECVIAAFWDLKNAFDLVNLLLLIEKLRFYGLDGPVLQWLRSYLLGRWQKVVLGDDIESFYIEVVTGVPQGSILGPLLFLIYINDLPVAIPEGLLILFVDDTNVVLTEKNKTLLLQAFKALISEMSKWFEANGLKLNDNKTQILNFHANYSNSYFADSSYLENYFTTMSTCAFLGLQIDHSLVWKNHIEYLVVKLSKAYFAILTLSQVVDQSVLKQVYYAYVYSFITYGIIFWGNSPLSRKVFLKQKKIIRIMMNSPRRASCRPLFLASGILPLPSVYILYSVLFVKMNWEEFFSRNNTHNYNTRNSKALQFPSHKKTFFEKTPDYSSIRLFNKLPN